MPDIPTASLTVPASSLSRFRGLLQRGVRVRVGGAPTALAFLVSDLGLDAAWVQARVTTVFLDGRVVDALDAAILRPGSILTLSAAMPGLVGATLRRGGPYAAMRAEITRAADRGAGPAGGAPALLRVKLFNLLLDEIGPALLARGVVLDRAEAQEVLGVDAPALAGGDVEVSVRVLRPDA